MESVEKRRRLIIFCIILIPAAIIAAIMGARYVREETEEREKIVLEKESLKEDDHRPLPSLEISSIAFESDIYGVKESIPKDAGESDAHENSVGDLTLGRSTEPEIQDIFTGYFQAKLSGDRKRADSYFAETAADTGREDRELSWSLQYIEDYRDITCYTVPGPEIDSYVVYVYYRTKFYQSETAAPSLSSAYVKKGEDGIYRVYDGDAAGVGSYLEAVAGLPSVTELASQVQKEFEDAVAADENLLQIYEMISAGPKDEEQESMR